MIRPAGHGDQLPLGDGLQPMGALTWGMRSSRGNACDRHATGPCRPVAHAYQSCLTGSPEMA